MLSDQTIRHLNDVLSRPDFTQTKYEIVGELGRGGMGTVYVAADRELEREVAIKVSNAVTSHPEFEARMRREAGIIAKLEHPGIVPIHDIGRLPDGRLFYVMKRVDGRLLSDVIAASDNRDDLLQVLVRVCEPVAFAHAHGVVHRDLKPENVMVGSFGEVLVMDWGVAKVLAEPTPEPDAGPVARTEPGQTDPGTVMGTPGYMPPEQALGHSEQVDARADVFALGAILYAMITRADPPVEPGADMDQGLRGHKSIPKRLRAICTKAMSVDRERRYAGAGELAADIRRFGAGLPVEAYPESVWERAGRLIVIYRTPILLVLAYLIMRLVVALVSG